MSTRSTILSALLLFFCGANLSAQAIWPGDINNNGRVNGVDWLYWAVGHQQSGPARPGASTNWDGQPMGTPWGTQFPSGNNYAYADVDGNGLIEAADAEGIAGNFGLTHGTLVPDAYPNAGGAAPSMYLEQDASTAGPDGEARLLLSIGSEANPVEALYGLTFVLEYSPHALRQDGIYFSSDNGMLLNQDEHTARVFIHNDSLAGRAEITIARTNQTTVDGFGSVGKFLFHFGDLQAPTLPDTLHFRITQVMAIDAAMNPIPLQGTTASFLVNGGGNTPTTGPCPPTVAPVCGSNGVTYLNSCYAEAAGVYDYTPGTCFSDCINPYDIDGDAVCPAVYDPVCGCNGITYANACEAEAAGVTSTTAGPCADNGCYDPYYVLSSYNTSLNPTTGVISANIPSNYDPVCGCNGVTYQNAYAAQASGITAYTSGSCGDGCINPDDIDPDAVCNAIYDPVCGCNGVTYANPCRAEAAGVATYYYGQCGGSSPWCSTATPIYCGDFLANETSVGAGNHINNYPGCSNKTFLGPDRIYMLNKTSAGDLQIGLEILTPGLDLDLFLLADNCGQVTCLRSSTTSNSATNNEGIVFEDAPIGTYYIVVDGQYASSAGQFRLEVSCGYLYCGDAVSLSCGQTYNGSNANGNDDVSLYGCDGNIFNVENNGPEVVHTFTTTTAGPVTINLTNLSANLELFLLRSCDRGDCMDYSQNPGSNSESITAFLQPGTYYVVVDGYNGAVSNYSLEVNCDSGCGLDLVNLSATPSACGQNTGSITISTSGGHPNYLIQYSGPVSGSFVTSYNSCTISNLPPGTYTVTKTDCLGCSVTGTVVIQSQGNLNATLTPTDAGCMEHGSIAVHISNGQPPYHVQVNGPTNGSVTVNYSNFNLTDLDPGNYTIHITDGNGCSITRHVTIHQSSGGFTWTGTPYPANCSQLGRIQVVTNGGTPPYTIFVTGPVSGSAMANSNVFNITNLPGGVYQVIIEDANWCSYERTIVVPDQQMTIDLTSNSGVCGENGSIVVSVSNGTPGYQIHWSGPVSGSTTTSNGTYTIPNLPTGSYNVTVTDNAGCVDHQTIHVNNAGGSLNFSLMSIDGGCNENGAIWIDIYNGCAPYTIHWTGTVSGSFTTDQTSLDIHNVPPGTYTVTITDCSGCSNTQVVVINTNNNLQVGLTPQTGNCGQSGSLLVSLSGGSPPYLVNWSGPSSGSTTTNVNTVSLPNLLPGNYTVTVTDSEGCTTSAYAHISSAEGNLELQTFLTHASCGSLGAIGLEVFGGTAPYQVNWSGPVGGALTSNSPWIDITDLPAGTYTIYVTDANGCTAQTTVTINNTGSNLNLSLVGNNAICDEFGNIGVYVSNGTAPYTINWSGPISGSATANGSTYQIPNTPAGTYQVVVTDANGCTVSNTVTVTAVNQLQATLNAFNGECGDNGSLVLNITSGTPNFQITWNGPVSGSTSTSNTTFTLNNLPSGTYTVVVTDANGCTRSFTRTISNTDGGLTIQTALIYNECGQYNTIWIDIFGGTGPYTITWTGTQNGSATVNLPEYEIMDLPPGTYKVTVVDANGCMTMQSGIIVYPAPITLFTATPNNGICGDLGSILVNITDGTPNYTLTWSGPVSGSTTLAGGQYTIPNLPSGVYTLTLTDSNGCAQTQTVSINNTVSNVDVITALIYNECGQYNTIWVDIVGGTPPYTITWTGPQNGSATVNLPEYEIMDLPPGTYKVTVIDANGCMDMQQDIIIYPAPINLFTATPTNGVCGEDGSITVDILAGTSPYVLSWNGPVSGSVGLNNGPYTIGNLPSGTYTITLIDGNGCAENETVVIDNGVADPIEIVTSLIYNECGQYNTIWVDVIGGTPPYTISWTGTQNGSATVNLPEYEIMDLPPGTYKVTVVDANGCMDMQQGIIIYPAPIDLFTAVPVNGVCSGPGSINISITEGTPNYTLTWNGPTSGSTVVAGNGFTIPNLPAGAYTITLLDANGCAETETVTVSSSESDVELSTTSNTGTCAESASIGLTVTGGAPGYTVSWAGPESGSANLPGNNFTIPDLLPGQYTVNVTDAQGCGDQSIVNVTIQEDDLAIQAIANGGDCGGNGSIDVSISGGQGEYLLTWTGPSNGSQVVTGSFYTIPNLPEGAYTIQVVDANGCSESKVVNLNNAEDDLVVSVSAVQGLCGLNGSLNVFFSGAAAPYTVSWSGPVNGSVTTAGTSINIPNLPAGTYTVTVTSGDCTDSATATLTNGQDNLTIGLTPTNGDCGELGAIGVNISGGLAPYTVSWSGPSSGSTTTGGTFFSIPNLSNGSYTVTVTSGSCSETATTTINNQPDNLGVSAIVSNGTCGSTGAITVNIVGGQAPYVVNWNGPVDGSMMSQGQTAVIPNLPSGTYNIMVISGSCQAATSATLNNMPNNLVINAQGNNGLCGNLGSIAVSVGGGTGTYTVSWTGPSSGSTTTNGAPVNIPNLNSGTYTVTVSNNGCNRTTTAFVNNTPNNLYVNGVPNNGSCGSDGAIHVTFGGGTGSYTISWSGPENGSVTVGGSSYTISGLNSGTYTITLNSGGCSTSTSTTLNNGTYSNITVDATAQPTVCGGNGNILVNISGGSAPYTVTWTGPSSGSATANGSYTISNVPGGTYNITVLDANGCGNSDHVYLPGHTLNLFVTAGNGNCGDNGLLDINFANGTGPYTLTWSGPVSGSLNLSQSNYILSNLPSGTYTVTVTDSNGCSATQSATINNGDGDFYVVHTVGSNGCGNFSNIWMDFYEGQGNYTINWTGPVSGSATTSSPFYDIINVPGGIYTITVIDGLGCVDVQQVTVTNTPDDLEVSFSPTNGSCGGPAKIALHISGGQAPFDITWSGLSSQGSITTSLTNYVINNLPAGTYAVEVTAANGCNETAYIQVATFANGMQVQSTVVAPGCNGVGAVGLVMGNSQPPYNISWTGQQSGTATSNVGSYMLTNLTPGAYEILIVDNNGCTGYADILMPGGPAGAITALFDTEVDGLSVDFNNLSNAGDYYWTLGDGTISNEQHPSHTYAGPGTYQVCLTVSAACGSDQYCETLTVMPSGNVALLDVGDGSAGPGGTVNVPVTIHNQSNIISLAGSFNVANPGLAQITGVLPGAIAPQYNVNNRTFSYFSNGGQAVNVTEGQVLFYLQVALSGAIGASTEIALADTPLPVELGAMVSGSPAVIPHNRLPGTVTVAGTGLLVGSVNTFWGDGVADAEVHISGPGYDEYMMTDAAGHFELPPMALGSEYNVTPAKDTEPANGLSTYGLFIGQRFLLGMEPPQVASPYQVIAGDANCNDAFTTLDLFLIQQLIIGATDDFAACPSWVFVAEGQDMPEAFNAYNVFPYASAQSMMLMGDTTANFVGVKVGDLLGVANPENRPGDLHADSRNGEELIFEAPNTNLAAGEEVTLYFRGPNFADVVSYQFGLLFDQTEVEFLGFEPATVEPFQTVAVGANEAEAGKLRLSWFSLDGFGHSAEPETVLFALRFRAITAVDDWSQILRISAADMLPEAYNEQEEGLDPVVVFTTTTNTWEASAQAFELEQNVPNPFRNTTTIGFTLPEASETMLTVRDALGREVWRQQRRYGAGHHTVQLDEPRLSPGVYHYTLRAGGQSATRSMIVLE